MKIIKTRIPKGSLAEKSFPRFDYCDAYSCVFNTARKITVEDVVMTFFNSSSKAVSALMKLRGFLVKPFGLKVPPVNNRQQIRHKNFTIQPGSSIGLFRVTAVSGNEVLAGEDDRHLNFRVSFYLEGNEQINSYKLTLSTTVFMNNLWGKVYFFPVQFFHKWIVRSMMKKMVMQLNAPSN